MPGEPRSSTVTGSRRFAEEDPKGAVQLLTSTTGTDRARAGPLCKLSYRANAGAAIFLPRCSTNQSFAAPLAISKPGPT